MFVYGQIAALAGVAGQVYALPQGGAGVLSYAGGVVLPATAPAVSHATSRSHGYYSGPAPTATGALSPSAILGTAITPAPAPSETYPNDGQLHGPEPIPYQPAGGINTNGTAPLYRPRSDWDFESLALALYQEWIELDLFNFGLQKFSEKDFIDAGLTAADRELIKFMANQEVGHATMLTNILGPDAAPKQCTYNYPFYTVQEFFDFCQKLTKFGEAGVYGYLSHLDSREIAQLLLQAITTEARQQLIFRQLEGLFPMPVWFEVGVPQSWAWSLLAPYITSCPANQTRLAWQNFPALTILNNPNPLSGNGTLLGNITVPGTSVANMSLTPDPCFNGTCPPAVANNRTKPLSGTGRSVQLVWEGPGKPVGPNNSYVTNTLAGKPAYVAWVSQLNVTYSPLTNIQQIAGHNGTVNGTANAAGVSGGNGTSFAYMGTTTQPNAATYLGDPAINGTIFVAVTDKNLYVTAHNLSLLNPHVVAGPALYQAG